MNLKTNNNIKSTLALAALHHVVDPEIGLNVVDLGLIYELNFNDAEKKVFCEMTLTTQFCPMGESIVDGVKNALQQIFGTDTIDIELTFDPAWSAEMISEEGRQFLDNKY